MTDSIVFTCTEYTGDERAYQNAAGWKLVGAGFEPSHLAWITPQCGTFMCINPDHLVVTEPVRIEYPYGICIYCGRSAHTKDHLLPKGWTGERMRRFVAVVPACGTCNNILGPALTWSITERRQLCHRRLRKKFARVLRTQDFTPEDLGEFGPTLQDYIKSEIEKKREVERMLAWPEDAAYDMRALQKSGIEDPFAIGLLHDPDAPLPSPHSAIQDRTQSAHQAVQALIAQQAEENK